MADFRDLLRTLAEADVRFIIVVGAAATAHGSSRLTQDLDVVYDRGAEKIARMVDALAPFKPYLRGAPPGLPLTVDRATVQAGLDFMLTTELGDKESASVRRAVRGSRSIRRSEWS